MIHWAWLILALYIGLFIGWAIRSTIGANRGQGYKHNLDEIKKG